MKFFWLKRIVSALLLGGGGCILSVFFTFRLGEYLFKSTDLTTAAIAGMLFSLQMLIAGTWIGWHWSLGSGKPLKELILFARFWWVNGFIALGIISVFKVFPDIF